MTKPRFAPAVLIAALGFAAVTLTSVGASAREADAPRASLSGRVADPAGNPVPMAEILVVELGRRTRSGADGAFELRNLEPGTYTVVVHRLGYGTGTRTVTLPAGGALAVTLAEDPFVLPPVQVTAARVPQPTLDSPLSTAFLSGPALERETSISLAHSLERLPGVRTVSTGAEIGKPMIRGLTGSRVLVMDDGHRLEDYSWSDEDGPSIDPAGAERVEVIRGPAGVLYGSDALSGVANVIAPEIPEASGVERFTRGRAAAYFGSNNREGGGSLALEGARDRWGWRASGTGRFAEALHTPDGELDNTGFSALTGDAAVALRGEQSGISLRYVRYGGEFKLLEAGGPPPDVTEGRDEGPERKASDDRLQLDGAWTAGSIRFEMKAQVERHSLIELSDEALQTDSTTAPGTLPVAAAMEQEAFNLLLRTATVDILAHHRLGDHVQGTAGLSGMLQSNDSRGPIPLVPDASISSGGAFLFEEARLGRWSVLGGVRGDARSLAADPDSRLGIAAAQDRSWTQAAGDLGVVYRPVARLAVTANAGLAWRAPTLFELFADGPQIAEARYLRGRHDLGAERALNLDGGVRWEGDRIQGEVSAFRNRIDDFVALFPTAATIGGLPVWNYDRTDALLSGMEMGLGADVAGPLRVTGRLDFARGEDRATGDPLPLIPPLRGMVGVEAAWNRLSWARRARVGVDVEAVGRKHRLAGNEIGTAGYALLGLDAAVTRTVFGRSYDLSLRVRNAANQRYRDFLSRYKAFADNPGRDVALRLETSF